jgi:hypothetical protein
LAEFPPTPTSPDSGSGAQALADSDNGRPLGPVRSTEPYDRFDQQRKCPDGQNDVMGHNLPPALQKKVVGGWPPGRMQPVARCNPFPWTPRHGRLCPYSGSEA